MDEPTAPEKLAGAADLFRIGKLTVKLEYAQEGPTMEEALDDFLYRLKSALEP